MGTININGRIFQGDSISVINDKVIIDGVEQKFEEKEINITVQGNVEKLSAEGAKSIKITGDVRELTSTSGSIEITGNAESVESTSGKVIVGNNINGNVETTSGKVEANQIYGKVKTLSGNINVKENTGNIRM